MSYNNSLQIIGGPRRGKEEAFIGESGSGYVDLKEMGGLVSAIFCLLTKLCLPNNSGDS